MVLWRSNLVSLHTKEDVGFDENRIVFAEQNGNELARCLLEQLY